MATSPLELSPQEFYGVQIWRVRRQEGHLFRYDEAGQLTSVADSRRGQMNYRYNPVGRGAGCRRTGIP